MSRFKKMKVFMIAAAMMLALSACGSSADQTKETNTTDSKTEEKDSSASAADSGNEKVELRFLLWGNQEEIDRKTQWTEEFNAENDKIHVNLEAIPEGFHEKLTVQI